MASTGQQAPTVLLVDDEDDIRLLWRLALTLHGGFGTIREASDGAEAIEMMETLAVDVVVTDFSMPHASGFEVLEAARVLHPTAIVIIASGTADVGDDALRLGAAAFFTKYESTTDQMPRLLTALLAEAEALEVPLGDSEAQSGCGERERHLDANAAMPSDVPATDGWRRRDLSPAPQH